MTRPDNMRVPSLPFRERDAGSHRCATRTRPSLLSAGYVTACCLHSRSRSVATSTLKKTRDLMTSMKMQKTKIMSPLTDQLTVVTALCTALI